MTCVTLIVFACLIAASPALLSSVEPVQMSVDCLLLPPQADNVVPEPPPGYGLKCFYPLNGSFVVSLGAGAYITSIVLVLYVHKAYCPLRQMLQLEWVSGESTVNESYEAGYSPEWKKGGITYTFSAPYPTSVRIVILHSNDYPTYSPQINTLTLYGERALLTTQPPLTTVAATTTAPNLTTAQLPSAATTTAPKPTTPPPPSTSVLTTRWAPQTTSGPQPQATTTTTTQPPPQENGVPKALIWIPCVVAGLIIAIASYFGFRACNSSSKKDSEPASQSTSQPTSQPTSQRNSASNQV